MKHPTVYYDQDGNNKKFSPAIHTGGYGDNHTEDEFFWAATELYFTTSETSYLEQAKQFVPDEFSIPSWGNVAGLGIFQWVNQELLGTPDAGKLPMKEIKESLKKNVMRISKNWLPPHSTVSSATAPKTSTGEATLKAAWEEALPKCTSMP